MPQEQSISVSQLPCGIFAFSNNGAIQYLNDLLLEKLQYSPEELYGKSIETIFTLSTRIFYQTHFFPILKLQQKANEIFLTLLTKQRKEIPVLVNAQQQFEDGRALNICVAITVDQRKKYEQEILQAKRIAEDATQKNEELQKVKVELQQERVELDRQLTRLRNKNEELSQLSNIFTHELQEPVRKVSMFTDIILNERGMLLNDRASSLFKIIFKSSRKMRSLLNGIQEYLNLDEKIERKVVDLSDIAAKQLKTLQTHYAQVVATVDMEELGVADGDEAQLSVLFKELLDNCFQFRIKEAVNIRISAAVTSENIFDNLKGKYKYNQFKRISIEDNGSGFDPATKEHIFRILKKTDITSEGLGMGLAICKKIVENHGGKIWAQGELGKGAKFVVVLPTEQTPVSE